MSDDLWAAASADTEAEHSGLALHRAKIACASLWPFLSMAATGGEFEHRLALAADTIGQRVPGELIEPVLASLRTDFRVLAADDSDSVEDEAGEDGDGDGGKPWEKSAAKHEDFEPDPESKRTDDTSSDADEDTYWSDLGKREPHEGRLQLFHAGLGRWVAVDDDANLGQGNPAYFTGGPEAGPQTGQTNQFPPFPGGPDGHESPLNAEYPLQPSAWTVTPGTEWVERPMQGMENTFSAASRRPFVAGTPNRHPWAEHNFESETGGFRGGHQDAYDQYPSTLDDVKEGFDRQVRYPHREGDEATPDPISHQYSESGDVVDFSPLEHSKHIFSLNSLRVIEAVEVGQESHCQDCRLPVKYVKGDGTHFWSHTGQHGGAADDDHLPFPAVYKNAYFDGGEEGVAGDQSGFPADPGLPEPDYRVDEYGAVPPQQSSGSTGDQVDQSYHSMARRACVETQDSPEPGPGTDPNAGTHFASEAEAERYRKLRATSSTGHTFYDPSDRDLRMVAVDSDPYGGDNPYTMDADNSTNPNDGASPPPPPPSMTGGPGSTSSNVPQTTSPRQMPGGDGGEMPTTARRVVGESRDLFSENNPSGVGDEFRLNQYEKAQHARPRQDATSRGVNTPQAPSRPVPIHEPAIAGGDEEDEDDD